MHNHLDDFNNFDQIIIRHLGWYAKFPDSVINFETYFKKLKSRVQNIYKKV